MTPHRFPHPSTYYWMGGGWCAPSYEEVFDHTYNQLVHPFPEDALDDEPGVDAATSRNGVVWSDLMREIDAEIEKGVG